ncbi:hypothetical protein BV22DRAFT_1088286, partial [Leucogyrophana mollusca]
MGPAPKSPQARRAGAPKAKGAVRAKSGCYTCRIRRKKCDEQPNEEGNCQTCVRLRLQCLGFGAKRPEWLRENRNVVDLREKIKGFLAAQGMIKGHSGSGPRSAEQEPHILSLSSEYASPSNSPQTPTLSISSSDEQLPVSSNYPLRDIPYSTAHDTHSPLDASRGHLYHQDLVLPYPNPAIMSSTSLDSSCKTSICMYNSTQCPPLLAGSLQTRQPLSAALASAFAPSYNIHFTDEDDFSATNPDFAIPPSFTPYNTWGLDARQNESLQHYMRHVLGLQYCHADKSLESVIWNLITANPSAREAACLLSDLHRKSISTGAIGYLDSDDRNSYNRVHAMVTRSTSFTEGEALAGLCIVSYFLFSGGKGQWYTFLDVACNFSLQMLFDPRYTGPSDALLRCSESARFIIKTSMWFDVLASATLVRCPHFMGVFREIFTERPATIDGVPIDPLPELSMMSVMGCENHIVLALARTAELAFWKEEKKKAGSLSVPQLVQRGFEIEEILQQPSTFYRDGAEQEMLRRRHLTSEVFRASARVYLHTVISGDYPQCPEIAEGVRDTVACLHKVPTGQLSRSVVRSAVFSICICGCLTDVQEYRIYLLGRLQEQLKEPAGNCSQVMHLMREVWSKRASGQPVDWRQVMRESEMLLV